MAFLDDSFLLETKAARSLYSEHAATQPIFDYQSRVSVRDIATDRRFENLWEIWLDGDESKWRVMRANGVPEHFCSGNAEPYEKFAAWAQTLPQCVRNPLFHSAHLELRRYFGVQEFLNPASAKRIWDQASERLASGAFSARGILAARDVSALCSATDPVDDLNDYDRIRASGVSTKVYPIFQPDRALAVDHPVAFNRWLDRLSERCNENINHFSCLLGALRARHNAFHALGCRLSVHEIPYCYSMGCSEGRAAEIFDRARAGQAASPDEHARFCSHLLFYCSQLDAERGWTKVLYLGAWQQCNTRARQVLGAGTGHDSVGDWRQIRACGEYIDRLNRASLMPNVIVHALNPVDSHAIATVLGSFQDGRRGIRMQLGLGWRPWTQKRGLEDQIEALCGAGLLSRSVGMATNARSLMSYSRHEYFRRVLCNTLGRDMETGELPNDGAFIGGMVRDVSYRNAARHLGLS